MQALVILMLAAVTATAGSDQGGTRRQDSEPALEVNALQAQVMLDRSGFSPGVIDGQMGDKTRQALDAYHRSGRQSHPVDATTTFTITSEVAAGPFQPVPSDMMEQASLPFLGYSSLLEALAERFHATPALLQRLNPSSAFEAGDEIVVPNVEPMIPPTSPESAQRGARPVRESDGRPGQVAARTDVRVTVSKTASALRVLDAGGATIFYAPVTTGSEHDPLPIGTWKVTGVQYSPKFHYNPDLFWDAEAGHSTATIQPGPNNPVGLVWIDITKEHYGLHGTPEPSTVGRAESHGCVRLTNWDALKLASLVRAGTTVVFTE